MRPRGSPADGPLTPPTGSAAPLSEATGTLPLAAFVGTVVYFLDYSEATRNIWGQQGTATTPPLGPILAQILSPLFVALWCFIGIEGAVALSGRARNKKDVGRATLIGFVVSLVICMIVSVVPFGVMTQHALSVLPNPSTAGVMKTLTGNWGEWFINVGVLISILTSWLAWTMICAEVPMAAAANGTFPARFARKNKHGSASAALWASSCLMQAVVLLVYFANNAWLALLAISSITVLPAYFASSAYLAKICLNGEYRQRQSAGRRMALIGSLIGAAFCVFMVYASALKYVVMTPLILTLGLPLYIWAQKKDQGVPTLFNQRESAALIALLAIDILVVYLYVTGVVTL